MPCDWGLESHMTSTNLTNQIFGCCVKPTLSLSMKSQTVPKIWPSKVSDAMWPLSHVISNLQMLCEIRCHVGWGWGSSLENWVHTPCHSNTLAPLVSATRTLSSVNTHRLLHLIIHTSSASVSELLLCFLLRFCNFRESEEKNCSFAHKT